MLFVTQIVKAGQCSLGIVLAIHAYMNATQQQLAAQIYRNAISHHRNQIKFLCSMIRDGSGHKPTCLKLAKDHAEEIKRMLISWELSRA